MFEVAVDATFAAAHALRNYHGKCENLHGHNYKVRALFRGKTLDESGMLIDFLEVKKHLRAVTESLDHQNLNELPPFDQTNPSAENLAQYIYRAVQSGMRPESAAKLAEVQVWETEIQYACYREG